MASLSKLLRRGRQHWSTQAEGISAVKATAAAAASAAPIASNHDTATAASTFCSSSNQQLYSLLSSLIYPNCYSSSQRGSVRSIKGPQRLRFSPFFFFLFFSADSTLPPIGRMKAMSKEWERERTIQFALVCVCVPSRLCHRRLLLLLLIVQI